MLPPMTMVLAHRGASHHYVPNTLDAFRAAITFAADGVELDVWVTEDGIPVVHHDSRLVDGRFIPAADYASLPVWVPSLEAVLAACRGLRLINIELKHDDSGPGHDPHRRAAGIVADLVAGDGLADRVLISSFDPAMLDRVRAGPDAPPTALLVLDPTDDVIAAARRSGHEAVNPWFGLLDEARVARIRDAGLAIHTWTVDHPDDLRRMGDLEVDSVITNRPDLAVAALGSG